MKFDHGFGDHSQDGELARWGLGRDTKWRSYYAQKRLCNAKPGNHLKPIRVRENLVENYIKTIKAYKCELVLSLFLVSNSGVFLFIKSWIIG